MKINLKNKGKILSILILCASLHLQGQGQKKVAKFDDGSTIEYDLIKNHADEMNKFIVHIGGPYDDRMSYFSLTYFRPDKFFLKANLLGSNYGIEGLIFFNSIVEDKPISLTLKSESVGGNTIMVSKVKENLKKKTYFGIHGGYAYKDYTLASSAGFGRNVDGLVAHEIAIGIGRLKGRYVEWSVEGRKKPLVRRGSSQVGIFADALIFPVRSYNPPIEIDNAGNKIEPDVNDVSTMIGGRVYLDGRTSFVGKGDVGFHYSIGVGYGVTKDIYPILGFGIYFGIKAIK